MEDKSKQAIPNSGKSTQTLINVAVLLLVLATCVYVVYQVRKLSAGFSVPDKGQNASNSPSGSSVSLQGLANCLNLSAIPATLDFGKQMTGTTSAVQTVTLTAKPDASVNITVTSPTDGNFVVLPSGCDLEPSASCALTVTFAPKHIQRITSSLTINAVATALNKAAPAPNVAQAAPNPATPKKAAPAPKVEQAVPNPPPATPNNVTSRGVILLTGEGTAGCPTGPVFPSKNWLWSFIPLLLVVIGYLVVLILVRWHNLALPTRGYALEAIDSAKASVNSLSDSTNPEVASIEGLLSKASDLFTGENPLWRHRWADYLFWNRGQEMNGWAYVHEAEERTVFFLPADKVRAGLERAESELRQVGTPPAVALADRINEALVATPALPVDRYRPVLAQVLAYLQLDADLSDRALDPASSATVPDCKKILEDAATALESTATTKLADQINAALKAVSTLTPLLEQASSLLDPRAAQALAKKIRKTLDADPPATLDQLKSILGEICAYFKPPTAAVLADSIQQALAAEPPVPIGRWKALLYEALGLIYDRKDTDFSALMSWSNKAMYLVCNGLLLIVSLGAVLGHGELFLLGAAGGGLSRLTRTLFREDVPTDYGAAWTTLFLSPVVGALLGWAGILMVILGYEFNILGSALKVDWCNPSSPVALGLAFVLGFSERFFMGILSQLESKVQANSTTSQPSPAAVTGPGPKVTSIEPKSGPAAGGAQVTITGTNFSVGAKVNFGGVAANTVIWKDKTSITATTPQHAVGTVDVEVANADGQKNALPSGYQYS